jgi:RNA polymerase sigma-70 factor (ECF subfamily)
MVQVKASAVGLIQAFFARLLEKQWIVDADRTRGRFRSFLLAAMNHFLDDEWDKTRAAKRGGGVEFLTIDKDLAETRLAHDREEPITPEQSYERRWALTLLDQVLGRLRDEFVRDGKWIV